MSKKAADSVFSKSGLTPADVQVVELHDCFSANELISYEALGLCPPGERNCNLPLMYNVHIICIAYVKPLGSYIVAAVVSGWPTEYQHSAMAAHTKNVAVVLNVVVSMAIGIIISQIMWKHCQ